ncbi:PAS domain S-box protein [Gracilimonas sp.]|uniref:PAS domain S-box protein n=1 Tax=Gracilimonas sp. TaxID=1974203 RepID=UPI003D151C35
MKKFQKLFQLNAVNIAFIYLVTGILWILFSDQLLAFIITDIEEMARYSTFKGILYVIVTAILLYLLVDFSNKRIKSATKSVDEALDSVKIATWSINLETNRNITSRYHYKLFGLKERPKKWNVQDFYDSIHPDDKDRVEQAFIEAIETKTPYKAEYRIIWPDGTVRWMKSMGNVQENDQGETTSISGIIQDITEQVDLEEKNKRRQELFERIFEQIPVMIDIYDPEVNQIRVNKAFEETLGWTNEEISEIDLLAACYPDPELKKKALKVMAEADGEWHTFEVLDKAGNTRIQEWSNIKLSDDTTIGIGLDVTDIKQKEQKLELVNRRFRRAEKIGKIGHIERDLKTGEITISQNVYNLAGLEKSSEPLDFEGILNLIHPEDFDRFLEVREEANIKGHLNDVFRIVKHGTNQTIYIHLVSEIYFDSDGNPDFVASVVQDVTQVKEYERYIEEQKELFENTIENLPIGVAVNHIDSGKVSLMNQRFSKIYGWPKNVITDLDTFFEKAYQDEEYRNRIKEMVLEDIGSKKPERMQWKGIKITTQTGEERIINAKNIPVYDQNLMISTVVDVTAQVEAEKRLAESEHNYRLLFQKSPQPMLIFNPDDLSIIEVNESAVRHYGYSREEFYTKTILDIRPDEDKEEAKQVIKNDRETTMSEPFESRHIKKNGEIINVRVTGSSITYFGKNYRLVLVNDITEQKQAEEMVLASLVEGENKERARIAQELHDGLGQYLAAANMNLDSVQGQISKLDERKQDQFNKGLNLLKHAVSETAQISRNLMPRVVDDYGLALAIEALVDNYSTTNDLDISYYQNIRDLELPREVQFNLYRIAQEALSNAVKYSKASQINVQLIKDELDLILTIDDNGIGFDTSDPDFTPGLGLQTIKTRTGALGGHFEFDSKPGKGTLISAIVPINKHTNAH